MITVSLLPEMLSLAVPLWQARLRRDGGPTEEAVERCRDWGEMIVGPGGEDLLFRGPRTTELFNDLAYVLAVMSFAPGGVSFGGRRWEMTSDANG